MTDSKTVLCVEDDEDSCKLIQILLEFENYQVKSCYSGKDALEMAKSAEFSAIILDNKLGEISGLEVCRAIRTYNQTIPIIFYSGAAFPKDIQAGLDAGAQAYLVKPNDLLIIPLILKVLLEKAELHANNFKQCY